jgi:hypothetical protein
LNLSSLGGATQLCRDKITQPEVCSVMTAGLMPDHVDSHRG